MANYQLSETATTDLDNLYLDGITNYGLRQADDYYDGLIEKFETLFNHPCRYACKIDPVGGMICT